MPRRRRARSGQPPPRGVVAVRDAPHPLRRSRRQQPPQPGGREAPVDHRAERSPPDAQGLVARGQGHAVAMLAVARRPFGEQTPGDAQGGQDRLVLGQAGLLGSTTGHDLLGQRSGSRTLEPGHLEIGADPRSGGRPNGAVGLLGRNADGERCAHRSASLPFAAITCCPGDRAMSPRSACHPGPESNEARPGCRRAAHRRSPDSRR